MSLQQCFFDCCTFRCPNTKNGCTFTYSGRDNSVTTKHVKECRYSEPKLLANRNINDVGSLAFSTQHKQTNDTDIHSQKTNCKEDIQSLKQDECNQNQIGFRSYAHDKGPNNVKRPRIVWTSSSQYKKDENTKADSAETTSSAELRKELKSANQEKSNQNEIGLTSYAHDTCTRSNNVEQPKCGLTSSSQNKKDENTKADSMETTSSAVLREKLNTSEQKLLTRNEKWPLSHEYGVFVMVENSSIDNSTDQASKLYQDDGNMLLPQRSSTFALKEKLKSANQEKSNQNETRLRSETHDESLNNDEQPKYNYTSSNQFPYKKDKNTIAVSTETTSSSAFRVLIPRTPKNDNNDAKLSTTPNRNPTKSTRTTVELNTAKQYKTKHCTCTLCAMTNARDNRVSNVRKNSLNNDSVTKVLQQSFPLSEQTMSSRVVSNDSETRRTEPEGFFDSLKNWFRLTLGSQVEQKVPYNGVYNVTSQFADTNDRKYQLDDKLDTYTYKRTFNELADAYSLKNNDRFNVRQKPATERDILQAIYCTGRQQTAGFSNYRKRRENQY